MAETMTRTWTVTEVVSISPKETALRSLLARVAGANDRGESPNKAAIVGRVPARTRGNHYRLLDELIRRHLIDPGPEASYALTVTAAGREVLETGTASATYEITETGVVVWVMSEQTVDGATFLYEEDTEEAAEGKALTPSDATAAITLIKEWRRSRWDRSGSTVLATRPLYQRDGSP